MQGVSEVLVNCVIPTPIKKNQTVESICDTISLVPLRVIFENANILLRVKLRKRVHVDARRGSANFRTVRFIVQTRLTMLMKRCAAVNWRIRGKKQHCGVISFVNMKPRICFGSYNLKSTIVSICWPIRDFATNTIFKVFVIMLQSSLS